MFELEVRLQYLERADELTRVKQVLYWDNYTLIVDHVAGHAGYSG